MNLKLIKVPFQFKNWLVCGIFDETGRIWHLRFNQEIANNFRKRLIAHGIHVVDLEIQPYWLKFFIKELTDYFEGKSHELKYPHFLLATDFEKRVLLTLRKIPYGQVKTYSWLAKEVGCFKGYRAVGRALASNPLPIFYPCHRIVAKHGLGGFSEGLSLKKLLLKIEGFPFKST